MNVVGPERCPRQFLHQVIFLAGTTRRRDEAKRIGPMLLLHFRQTFGNRRDRFVPAGRMQLTISTANQRLGNPVFMMNEVISESAFDAEVSIVKRFTRLGAGDFYDSSIVRVQVKLTPNAAKVTCRSSRCCFQRHEILWRLFLD